MSANALHRISRSICAKALPIHEMDTGAAASDVIVRTITRFAMRTILLGRPRPHGRQEPPDRVRGIHNQSKPHIERRWK